VAKRNSPRRLFAFLRAINVGGRNIAMAELRRVFEGLGLKEVETFIASGNVVFNSDALDLRSLELAIEKRLRATLGYEVNTFIRTEEELAAMAKYKPFKKSHLRDATALNVGFLAEAPGPAAQKLITTFKSPIDDFEMHGREVYWLCQTGQGVRRLATKYALA
jgi:uncharacterized protein (DUF1697 family)